MAKTIEVEIDLDGVPKIITKGFKGKSCINAADFIKKALGKEVSMEFTSEFYMPEEKNLLKNSY